ncbi:MAG: CoB--CoM heterodisulfide reductase iron-sulfur subunit A family protein [Candidatus Lokiarchaeota archaeon]|nr:CoB--CoM heterodisulfide reductase iron-sulfur subunit A family protein [Candidatus Lokiarchaeota archaeon]
MEEDLKIGVYLCHCGVNIAGVIDMDELEEFTKTLPNVNLVRQYKFMCSDTGQSMIKDDIKEGLVNRVVVAACSPRMHEPTFRRAIESAGMNKFLFSQANIREHSSWISMKDKEGASRIAKDHIRMQVAKVSKLESLQPQKVKVTPNALVIGGGIAGINAALDLAEQNFHVYLVEKTATIGGHMAQLDKTFPTMDCSACILTPKMVDVNQHENITLMAYSEVDNVEGYVGNFKVTVRQKARYVDTEKCTGCGNCAEECPVTVPNEFDLGLSLRKAAYLPFPQAVPGYYTIDMDHCIKCGICADPSVCEPDAIRYDDKDKFVKLDIGTIIVATGFDPFDPTALKEYGYEKYDNVITSMQMERLLSSYGPTLGKPVRPSDLTAPHSIAFIQCVGSRDFHPGRGHKYCSRVCCMYAMKQARQYMEKHPDAKIYIFYMDIRAFGKGYEEFYEIASREYGIMFIRGRLSEVYEDPKDKGIWLRGEDTLLQVPVEIKVDMVVLSVGIEARDDSDKIASLLSIQKTEDGFFMEAHPKLRPVDTLTDGIFIAGVSQGPKDIPDAVAQAKGAASSAAALMAKGEVEIEPYFAVIDEAICTGCKACNSMCPFGAITFDKISGISVINPAKCKGCGTCVAACPFGAIAQNHFKEEQLDVIIRSVLKEGGVY